VQNSNFLSSAKEAQLHQHILYQSAWCLSQLENTHKSTQLQAVKSIKKTAA